MTRLRPSPTRRAGLRLAACAIGFPLILAACQSPSAAGGAVLPALTADCARCHGPTGFTKDGRVPPLAGRPEASLVAMLGDIRAGRASHPPMAVAASTWSDDTIAALARYYSRIR